MGNVLGIHPALLLSDHPLDVNQTKTAKEHSLLYAIYKSLDEVFCEKT